MPLKEQLTADLRDAMRQSDDVRKSALRMLLTAIKNAEVPKVVEHRILEGDTWKSVAAQYGVDAEQTARAWGHSLDDSLTEIAGEFGNRKMKVVIPAPEMDDKAVSGLIAMQIKQRRDSIDAFQKAGRQDLVDKEAAELKILEAYMPPQMPREEIEAEARKAIAEVGAKAPSDKGKVMQTLMPRLSGRADGRDINEVVTALLAG